MTNILLESNLQLNRKFDAEKIAYTIEKFKISNSFQNYSSFEKSVMQTMFEVDRNKDLILLIHLLTAYAIFMAR